MIPKQLINKKQAEKILKFFSSGNAFWWNLAEWNQEIEIKKRVNNALTRKNNCAYWFIENESHDVIAAGSAEEDTNSKGGYFIGWFAVHKQYRRQGLGTKIIRKCEEYIKNKGGSFITIGTAEDNKEANAFYQAMGYQQVGLIPDYYKKGVGKVYYWKRVV